MPGVANSETETFEDARGGYNVVEVMRINVEVAENYSKLHFDA